MNRPLNIVFAGTPDFAARHLQALLDSQHKVIAVYTQPDRPAGRGKKLQASAVKLLAEEHNLEVFQPQNLKTTEQQDMLRNLNADVLVVVAYGLILPQAILDIPVFGCLNVHGSLLPKWRGAAPIQRAVWAGDEQTGVTVMQMDQGLDTGAMLLKRAISIESTDTSATLYNKLAQIGPDALLDTLDQLEQLSPEKQDESQATYAHKLSKQEAKIDWQEEALQLERNIRAFNPWPVAYFELEQQQEKLAIKVWQASVEVLQDTDSDCRYGQIIRANKQGIAIRAGDGVLNIHILQVPGKKPASATDVLNARRDWFKVGTLLQ